MGKHTVLLVENDSLIRDALESVLDREFEVLSAGTFEEGRGLLERGPDVLLTDYDLEDGAGRTGTDLVRLFHARHPLGGCVLMSGGFPPEKDLAWLRTWGGMFLEKPFANSELLALLAAACKSFLNDDPHCLFGVTKEFPLSGT